MTPIVYSANGRPENQSLSKIRSSLPRQSEYSERLRVVQPSLSSPACRRVISFRLRLSREHSFTLANCPPRPEHQFMGGFSSCLARSFPGRQRGGQRHFGPAGGRDKRKGNLSHRGRRSGNRFSNHRCFGPESRATAFANCQHFANHHPHRVCLWRRRVGAKRHIF